RLRDRPQQPSGRLPRRRAGFGLPHRRAQLRRPRRRRRRPLSPPPAGIQGGARSRDRAMLHGTKRRRRGWSLMELVPKRKLELLSGRSHLALAEEIAAHLGVGLSSPNLVDFA